MRIAFLCRFATFPNGQLRFTYVRENTPLISHSSRSVGATDLFKIEGYLRAATTVLHINLFLPLLYLPHMLFILTSRSVLCAKNQIAYIHVGSSWSVQVFVRTSWR